MDLISIMNRPVLDQTLLVFLFDPGVSWIALNMFTFVLRYSHRFHRNEKGVEPHATRKYCTVSLKWFMIGSFVVPRADVRCRMLRSIDKIITLGNSIPELAKKGTNQKMLFIPDKGRLAAMDR